MTTRLDWKWIGIGVLIMLALNVAAGFILAMFLGPAIQGATTIENMTLTGSQLTLLAIVNFLVFVLGGFIVGLKSAGRTILEPGISAAIAVVIGLLLSGQFSLAHVVAGGLVPLFGGVLGGWLGERRQGTA